MGPELTLTLLVVGDDETARRLAGSDGFSVDSTDRDTLSTTVGPAYDVVVLVGAPLLDGTALSAVRAAGVPVVAYATEPPTAAWLSGFVRRTDGDDAVHLADEIRHAAEGQTRLQLRERRRQLARLHDGTTELAAVRSTAELYDRCLEVAAEVVRFDHAVVLLREGDRLQTVASTEGDWAPESESTDSLAGATLAAGAPRLVDDVRTDERATTHGTETVSVLSVPIGDDGVLQLGATEPNAFTAPDVEIAQLLAAHVEETRERLSAEADARSRRERITALHRAATDLIDAETPDELYDRTVEIAADVLRFDGCALVEATPAGFRVLADAADIGAPGEIVRGHGDSVMEATYTSGESIVVDDVTDDDRATPSDDSYRSGVSVPFGENGVFQAVSAAPNAYDETDLELAELLVSYATTTLERIESEQALRESRETTERLHEAATRVAAADDESEVIERAMAAAKDVLAFDLSSIDLVSEDGRRLIPAAISDETVQSEPRSVDDENLASKTYRTGEVIVVDDLAAESDADPTKQEYRAAISLPLGDVGVFQAVSTETAAFDSDDVERAELLMAHVAVSLERVRAEAGLRDERDRLSALFENIPDAVVSFEMTADGPIVGQVNEAFEETFGYDESALVGENLDEYLVPEAETEVERDTSRLNERLRAGENVRHEGRRQTADGLRDFLMYVVPLELGTENVAGYAIYSDITERKERERELRHQNERLDEFASVVSHDLRNPISIADGWLDMARKTGDPDHFDRVQEAIDRMEALVEDLLTLAREGEVVGDAAPVELAAVAESAWGHVDTANATLDTGDTDGLTVEADADRLSELFENLYRNAVEHGGPDVAVRVARTESGFVVADDGPGVPEEERDEVFDAGVTHSEDGTGFGLPIVRRIAEAHGWSVDLDESSAGGAAFHFET
ncbi:GAF domain-containing protein [Halobaculum sp. MBLA0143]|uniref:GAF domain-containing protein n=1 Tax=Halobaculum sp. MBLA0143 TaxID=3079933 RepID=UPI003523E8AC